MNKRRIIIIVSVIVILAAAIGIITLDKYEQLLSGSVDNIQEIQIGPHIFTDKDDVGKIYEIIIKTNTTSYWFPQHEQAQYSDPKFVIRVKYNNGNGDHLLTTESGKYIFKQLPTKDGYVGGFNEYIFKIFNTGTVE